MEKTIPIEIVLQDPSDPIVPTPDTPSGTDTTDGTAAGTTDANINISVPDTGKDTSSTNGGSSVFTDSASSTIAIASIAILVLAIVTSIALVVRRYYKRKKANEAGITRQEKRAAIATSTIAVLAITVLLGQLATTVVVQPLTTNAAEGTDSTEPTYLDTVDKIQIVANRYDDVTIVATTKNISYATTDTDFGYKIFMSMAGEDANLYLDGDNTSEYYFAPTAKLGLSNNSWGYSLNGDGEDGYFAMPVLDDPLMAQHTTTAVEDEEFTVYYTMKADKDIPFGVYSGEITYEIQGYNGFPSTLTSMQDMTPEICEAVYTPSGTETVVPTATLVDTRDQKTYEIAKLADGNCWMTQNLDLDLNSQTALTPENTNISANWTPVNSTTAFTGTSVSGWTNSSTVPYSADPGEVYYYSSGTTSNDEQYTSLADCQATHPDCSGHNHAGNYYNWSAAVANNDTSSLTEQFSNAEGSICPAGWRLPKITGNEGGITDSEFGSMLVVEGVINKSVDDPYYVVDGFKKIRTAPLWLIQSGGVVYGSMLGYTGSSGFYWSGTVRNNNNAYRLDFSSSTISPANASTRNLGFSIRCLAE